MKFSTERILTTHAGALPQPPDLKQMHGARDTGTPLNADAFRQRVRAAVAEVVKKQIDCGLDVINDGEVGKSNFSRYARDRLNGFTERNARAGEQASTIFARDLVEFSEYFKNRTYHRGDNVHHDGGPSSTLSPARRGMAADARRRRSGDPVALVRSVRLAAAVSGVVHHLVRIGVVPQHAFAVGDPFFLMVDHHDGCRAAIGLARDDQA